MQEKSTIVDLLCESIQGLLSGMNNAFRACNCENCLRDNFIECVLKKNGVFENIAIPKNMQEEGFFNYKAKHSDIEFKFKENNVLVECKFIRGNNGCEIRNGIGQLIEYLLVGKWNMGILLCFDKTEYKELTDRDKWFMKKFSMKNCYDENLKRVAVAIFFIYQGNNGIEIKSYNVDEL